MTEQEIQTTKERNYTPLLIVITLLLVALLATLVALLATNLFSLQKANTREEEYVKRVAEYEIRANLTRDIIDMQIQSLGDVVSNYEKAAYGPDVDRIAEQQLLAAEHQLLALQTIGMQNAQLMSLVASLPFPTDSTLEEENSTE
ncbi:MAG: hypothetical protein BMS9Abin02_1720 [Anaerolineae bacterium]|nr:MAG: hypothetical protein BMS9Abin02_1720 [Anaerolineae bacterium]